MDSFGFEEISPAFAWSGSYNKKKKKDIPLSLARLTKEEWDAMNGKAKWDSTVALRGPDLVGSSTIKYYTTSVIRHRLSGVMRVGGQVNDWLPCIILPESYYSTGDGKKGTFDLGHFLEHVRTAAEWLNIPIVQVPSDAWKKSLLLSIHDALTLVSPDLPENLRELLASRGFKMKEKEESPNAGE